MKNISLISKNQFSDSEIEEVDVWPLPHVEDTELQTEEKTNAVGKKSQWRFEPPEETIEEEPVALTIQQIDEIREAAHEEGFNQGKEEGFSKGYREGKEKGLVEGKEEGFEQGQKEGVEAGNEQIETLSLTWQKLIEQLHTPLENVDKNVEEQLLELVVSLTEAVVLEEAKTNPSILMSAITEGIKSLPSSEAQTQILLHPDDIKMVEQQFGDEHISESGWRLLPAPQLERGGCQIENSTSTIDLQIKSKLKEVITQFLQEALHHG
ncbi:MAG: flagellar assembly protein FliH [Colwellia sp.]